MNIRNQLGCTQNYFYLFFTDDSIKTGVNFEYFEFYPKRCTQHKIGVIFWGHRNLRLHFSKLA